MRIGVSPKKLLESSAPLPPSLHHVRQNLFLYSPPLPAARLQSSRAGNNHKVLVDPSLSHAKKSHVEDELSANSLGRNFQSTNQPTVTVDALNEAGLALVIREGLRRAFGEDKSAVKQIMDAANCNERTARNWYEGKNTPNALYLLRLMKHVPELRAECRRLTAMQTDLDPHFERAMHDAIGLFQKMQTRKP